MSGKFGLLKANEIEVRASRVFEERAFFLLYKTARTDANVLDRVIGPENWQNDFKVINEVLFGGIGVLDSAAGWVWKWDAGEESNVSKDKGEASDAFKRAGFKWGIGRELYSAPFISISSGKIKIEKNAKGAFECKTALVVSEIECDDNEEIKCLVITAEHTGEAVFAYARNRSSAPAKTPARPAAAPKAPTAGTISAQQKATIVGTMKSLFGTENPMRGEAFEILTGFDPLKLSAIPASEYAGVMKALAITPDKAKQILVDLEQQALIERGMAEAGK